MARFTVKEVIEATGGRLYQGDPDATFTGLSTDSRAIEAGELFIPLKGERFDGHAFLHDALVRGKGALVSAPAVPSGMGGVVIIVGDTLKALQDLAHHARMKIRATVIGITGTNGKTTTKELTASILGVGHRVLKNAGNLNNHIGLPLSLAGLTDGHEFAVLEMGASKQGDISELCDIAVPDLGIITNIGMAHLEGFGTLEAVRRTKLELSHSVRTLVLNADDRFLMEGFRDEMRRARRRPALVTFGLSSEADVYAQDVRHEERRTIFTLRIGDTALTEVALSVPGRFNVSNALAAAAAGNALGVDMADIRNGIESFAGVPMRLEIRRFLGATVLSDSYNANPASMEEAFRELVRMKKKRAIAVLGDMLELGSFSEEVHRSLGERMAAMPVDILIAVGPFMSIAAAAFSAVRSKTSRTDTAGFSRVFVVSESSEAGRILADICEEGDTVLVKGSRGMRMERALEGSRELSSSCAGGTDRDGV